MAHETIYQALYVQAKGSLRREVASWLRTGHVQRRRQRRPGERQPRMASPMVMISERPPEVADRAVPGHWKGDLIMGARNQTAIGTLVERSTRFVMLPHLPDGYHLAAVRDALTAQINTLPEQLRRSLIWDQGSETTEGGAAIHGVGPSSRIRAGSPDRQPRDGIGIRCRSSTKCATSRGTGQGSGQVAGRLLPGGGAQR